MERYVDNQDVGSAAATHSKSANSSLVERLCAENAETIKLETMELVQRSYSDHVAGKYAIGAFCRPVVMEQEV